MCVCVFGAVFVCCVKGPFVVFCCESFSSPARGYDHRHVMSCVGCWLLVVGCWLSQAAAGSDNVRVQSGGKAAVESGEGRRRRRRRCAPAAARTRPQPRGLWHRPTDEDGEGVVAGAPLCAGSCAVGATLTTLAVCLVPDLPRVCCHPSTGCPAKPC